MDISHAISEPLAALIDFHDSFNRNIKLTYGALARVGEQTSQGTTGSPVALPNGGEPWGRSIPWRDVNEAVREAAVFVVEIGLARAASAFEDYIIRATAEHDRAVERRGSSANGDVSPLRQRLSPNQDDADVVVPSLQRLATWLGVDLSEIAADATMVAFFDVARNCVVHRSNRASRKLAELRSSEDLAFALKTWPRRRGKWTLDVPDVSEGKPVPWLPRHAIMASAAYHRCAVTMDKALVAGMGDSGMIAMAARWCLLDDNPVPCAAKLDAQTMVRFQLMGRYGVRDVTIPEIVNALREVGTWEAVQQAFAARGLIKAAHAKRRARKERRK